jgi:hypothetical protein
MRRFATIIPFYAPGRRQIVGLARAYAMAGDKTRLRRAKKEIMRRLATNQLVCV